MPRFTDLMELKNDTARTNAIRERVSKMIFENWQREDVSDLLDIIEDDIRTTMFNLGIYGDDYDE